MKVNIKKKKANKNTIVGGFAFEYDHEFKDIEIIIGALFFAIEISVEMDVENE